jgi:CheY-like chemotaxis protein
MARAALRDHGAIVESVSGAVEAIDRVAAGACDVLVSDIAMPGRDGLEMMRELRARVGATLPAIALSALAREEDVRAAKSAGFDVYLAKPIDPDALAAAVATVAPQVDA